MIPVFKINYTIEQDDGDIVFTDFFFVKLSTEVRDEVHKFLNDLNIDPSCVIIDDCAIHGSSAESDVTITVEMTQIYDDVALKSII